MRMTESLHSTEVAPIRVILVLTVPPAERHLEGERRAEMTALLDTAGCSVVGEICQHLARPISSTYIGSGKCEEARALAEEHEADEIVFDCELSPSQERNLERAIDCKVIDYTALILHIFARNAHSHQAQLAVELAQLEHNRSRLKRLWTHLDRMKAGMNMRGPGEKQLEVDRRLVDTRIADLKDKLADIERRKVRAIAGREDCFKICLVGYTNAGKSTLMNALTDAGVLAQDRLFATLDTRTARIEDIESRRQIVLSDTVGFIRKLPHGLIASFHATLAEALEADLLLHVVDASHPAMDEQASTVEQVLATIGADHIPTLLAFNKVDLGHSPTLLLAYQRRHKGSVACSALTGQGIEELREAIRREAHRSLTIISVRFPIGDGAMAAFLRRRVRVLDEQYDEQYALFRLECDERLRREIAAHPQAEILPDADPTPSLNF